MGRRKDITSMVWIITEFYNYFYTFSQDVYRSFTVSKARVEAPISGYMVLTGVLLKLGVY